MTKTRQDVHSVPFTFADEVEQNEEVFASLLQEAVRARNSHFMSSENTLAYSHGQAWRSHESYQPDTVVQMTTLASEMSLDFDAVISGDLTIMLEKFTAAAESLHSAMMRHMYQTISDVCDAEGQSVRKLPETSIADSFLEALQKIEFGVDRDGKVVIPSIHAGKEMAQRMLTELQNAGPEFEQKVKLLREEKEREALRKEEQRRARFKGFSSDE